MMTTFQDAAASYFGLAETNLRKTEVFSDGELIVAFEVTLTSEDVMAIADRMRTMGEQQAPAEPEDLRPTVGWTRDELREQYNALTPAERSQYGAFSRYVAARGGGDPYTMVAQIELPPHVYLTPAETTSQQRVMAIGRDEKGNYAIAVEDLTEEQKAAYTPEAVVPGTAEALRAGYVQRTVAAMERLNGTDGKPTSNADDFGGVPG